VSEVPDSGVRTAGRAGKPARDRIAFHAFWVSAVFLALSYGVLAGMLQLFPYSIFASAVQGYGQLRGGASGAATNWYYRKVPEPLAPPIGNPGGAHAGLNLVTEIDTDALVVKVMDLDGATIHRWTLDWFTIWPDATHVPERLRPRTPPGTHVNGAALLDGGDLVFNFEHLGLVRVDRRGAVVWRLPYQTHHSVHRDDDGNLWVCGQREHLEPMVGFPNLVPPFVEDTVLVVSPAGRIEHEWSVLGLLRSGGRQGLLCLANLDNFSTTMWGDLTHLNHVEPFPANMPAGFFKAGDVLVSLRNVNTVFVFERSTGQIKFSCTGQFVRQHDPHFVDGNTFSVFDNHNLGPMDQHAQSRILLVSAPSEAVQTYYSGTPQKPFFTPILGRHQWLPNGHLLITDSCAGRAFELDGKLEVVWRYVHYVEPGVVGAIEQVERIPQACAAWFR
jgi:hypothetical protein